MSNKKSRRMELKANLYENDYDELIYTTEEPIKTKHIEVKPVVKENIGYDKYTGSTAVAAVIFCGFIEILNCAGSGYETRFLLVESNSIYLGILVELILYFIVYSLSLIYFIFYIFYLTCIFLILWRLKILISFQT